MQSSDETAMRGGLVSRGRADRAAHDAMQAQVIAQQEAVSGLQQQVIELTKQQTSGDSSLLCITHHDVCLLIKVLRESLLRVRYHRCQSIKLQRYKNSFRGSRRPITRSES